MSSFPKIEPWSSYLFVVYILWGFDYQYKICQQKFAKQTGKKVFAYITKRITNFRSLPHI